MLLNVNKRVELNSVEPMISRESIESWVISPCKKFNNKVPI